LGGGEAVLQGAEKADRMVFLMGLGLCNLEGKWKKVKKGSTNFPWGLD